MSTLIVHGRIPIRKRFFDLLLALPGLILLSPLFGLLALLIWWTEGSPVFFLQIRPGYREKLFKIIKFRTMKASRDARGNVLPEEQRITRLGHFLRATSLDELPELINVIRGEMSLVGPRPLLEKYLPRYSPEQARRHQVLPGISGWAQINGRNTLSWQERFRMDVWYVDHWSLFLDVKILALTIGKVFKREGINPSGQAIMGEFMGNDPQEEPSFTPKA
jgi:lipopolysaccharide/colanic/teichoic acid biosynthesis glycosyltransferase